MSPKLEIRLLGAVEVLKDGVPLKFYSNKVRALFIYLMMEARRGPVARPILSDLLWPRYKRQSGSVNLRKALSELRKALSPVDVVCPQRADVLVDLSAGEVWVDVLELFEVLGSESGPIPSTVPVEDLLWVSRLSAGTFCDGLDVEGCEGFAAWRDQWAARVEGLLRQAEQAMSRVTPAELPGRVPNTLTRFFGREEELASLLTLGRSERWLTVLGDGGIGKTRLAREVLRSQPPGEAVAWVSLSELSPSEADGVEGAERLFLVSILQAVSDDPSSRTAPLDLLARIVGGRALLVALDGAEAWAEGAIGRAVCRALAELLRRCPGLRILVTSRRPLGAIAERVVRIAGLRWNPRDDVDDAGGEADAVRLFKDRFLRRAEALGTPLPPLAQIVSLCRRVEGHPLAVELAAVVAASRGLEVLSRSLHAMIRAEDAPGDLPERHAGLAAVFESSWLTLRTRDRVALAALALFLGPLSCEDAQALLADQDAGGCLERLSDYSLLIPLGGGWYRMHAVVRELSVARLDAPDQPWDAAEVRRRYWRWVLADLVDSARALERTEAHARRRALSRLDDLRQAHAMAIEAGDLEAATSVSHMLHLLLVDSGLVVEAQALVQAALRLLDGQATVEADRLRWSLSAISAVALFELGRLREAEDVAAEVLRWSDVPLVRGVAHLALARCRVLRADLVEVDQHLQQVKEISHQGGPYAPWLAASADIGLASMAMRRHEPLVARDRLSAALQQVEAHDLGPLKVLGLLNLGRMAEEREDPWSAARAYGEGRRLATRAALPRFEAAAAASGGVALCVIGEVGAGREELQRAVELAQRRGQGIIECMVTANWAQIEVQEGNFVSARPLALRASMLAREAGADRRACTATATLGYACARTDPRAARRYFDQAVELGSAVHEEPFVAEALAGLLLLEARLGQHRPDGARMERLEAYLARDPDLRLVDHCAFVGLVLFELGRLTGVGWAMQGLRAARSCLLAMADRAPSLMARRMFLEDVALHRTVMETWRDLNPELLPLLDTRVAPRPTASEPRA